MESAPQSTIAHNAVIELASRSWCTPRRSPRARRAHKKKACPPKRAALNRRDHAKITLPAQRRGEPKPSISAGICVEAGAFRENPRNGCRRGAAALSPCPRRRGISELMTPRQSPLLNSRQPRLDLLL